MDGGTASHVILDVLDHQLHQVRVLVDEDGDEQVALKEEEIDQGINVIPINKYLFNS